MSVPDPFAEFDEQPVEPVSPAPAVAPAPAPVEAVEAVEADPFAEFDEQMPVGSAIDAVVEPLTSIASSVAGASGAGVAEMGELATGATLDEALETGEGVQQSMAEFGAPQTQAGQYGLEKVGDLMELGLDVANMPMAGLSGISSLLLGKSPDESANLVNRIKEEGYFNVLADETYNKTESPWMATAVKMAPEIAGAVLPIKNVWKHRGSQSLPEQELAQRIIEGDVSGELAKYVVDGAGKLKYDPVSQRAVDAGMDQGLVSAIKGLPEPEGTGVLAPGVPLELNPTKQKMLDMLEIKRKGYKDQFYADKNRPSDVTGDAVLERFNDVKRTNKEAGEMVDEQSKALKGQYVDFAQPIDNFLAELESLGVQMRPNLTLDFKGSDIEGLKAPETALNKIVERMKSGGRGQMPDAHDLHRMKRYIDEVVAYGKNAEGLTGRAERVVKQLRSDIDDALDGQFPAYDEANTQYADTIGVLNDFQDVAGRRMDLTGAGADRQVGILMRRILSNAQSAQGVLNSVNNLERVAKLYGGEYGDNLGMLISFQNQLDKIFGSSASTSFQSEISSGVLNSLNKMDDGRGVGRKAKDFVMKGVNKAFTPDEYEAFDTIEKVISGRPDPWRK